MSDASTRAAMARAWASQSRRLAALSSGTSPEEAEIRAMLEGMIAEGRAVGYQLSGDAGSPMDATGRALFRVPMSSSKPGFRQKLAECMAATKTVFRDASGNVYLPPAAVDKCDVSELGITDLMSKGGTRQDMVQLLKKLNEWNQQLADAQFTNWLLEQQRSWGERAAEKPRPIIKRECIVVKRTDDGTYEVPGSFIELSASERAACDRAIKVQRIVNDDDSLDRFRSDIDSRLADQVRDISSMARFGGLGPGDSPEMMTLRRTLLSEILAEKSADEIDTLAARTPVLASSYLVLARADRGKYSRVRPASREGRTDLTTQGLRVLRLYRPRATRANSREEAVFSGTTLPVYYRQLPAVDIDLSAVNASTRLEFSFPAASKFGSIAVPKTMTPMTKALIGFGSLVRILSGTLDNGSSEDASTQPVAVSCTMQHQAEYIAALCNMVQEVLGQGLAELAANDAMASYKAFARDFNAKAEKADQGLFVTEANVAKFDEAERKKRSMVALPETYSKAQLVTAWGSPMPGLSDSFVTETVSDAVLAMSFVWVPQSNAMRLIPEQFRGSKSPLMIAVLEGVDSRFPSKDVIQELAEEQKSKINRAELKQAAGFIAGAIDEKLVGTQKLGTAAGLDATKYARVAEREVPLNDDSKRALNVQQVVLPGLAFDGILFLKKDRLVDYISKAYKAQKTVFEARIAVESRAMASLLQFSESTPDAFVGRVAKYLGISGDAGVTTFWTDVMKWAKTGTELTSDGKAVSAFVAMLSQLNYAIMNGSTATSGTRVNPPPFASGTYIIDWIATDANFLHLGEDSDEEKTTLATRFPLHKDSSNQVDMTIPDVVRRFSKYTEALTKSAVAASVLLKMGYDKEAWDKIVGSVDDLNAAIADKQVRWNAVQCVWSPVVSSWVPPFLMIPKSWQALLKRKANPLADYFKYVRSTEAFQRFSTTNSEARNVLRGLGLDTIAGLTGSASASGAGAGSDYGLPGAQQRVFPASTFRDASPFYPSI